MRPKDLILDNCSQRQVVKQICEHFPSGGVLVLPHALVVEPIVLCDVSALMVTTKDCYAVFVAHLQRQQKAHRFHRVVASIHVIAKEQVVCIGDVPTNLEQLDEVVELAVNVTAYDHRSSHRGNVRFLRKNFPTVTSQYYLALSQSTLTSGSVSSLHLPSRSMKSSKLDSSAEESLFIYLNYYSRAAVCYNIRMDSMEEKLPGANNPSRPSNQLLPSTTDLERRKKITKKNEISTFINKTFKILEV